VSTNHELPLAETFSFPHPVPLSHLFGTRLAGEKTRGGVVDDFHLLLFALEGNPGFLRLLLSHSDDGLFPDEG
jgi:hypothetical protein